MVQRQARDGEQKDEKKSAYGQVNVKRQRPLADQPSNRLHALGQVAIIVF